MANDFDKSSSDVPLVLVHGTCGKSEDWSQVLSALSPKRTVIRPDYGKRFRDQGLSKAPTLTDFVLGVTAELDALGLERFDLFGASLGAAIAVAFAAENPEKVNSMVLQSGFAFGGDIRLKLLFDLWLRLANTDRVAFTKLILATGFTRHFLAALNQPTVEAIVQGFVDSSDWPMIDEAIQVDISVDIRDAATRIKAPVLVITAKHDEIIPPGYSEDLVRLIPHASRSELDSGHLTFLERPKELATALLDFFEAQK